MIDSIFVFGAGYSGRAFAEANAGRSSAIFGTTRLASKFDAVGKSGMTPLLFDGNMIAPDVSAALARSTHLIVSVAPEESGDPVLRAIGDVRRAMPALQWIGYLSTVGVYGDHDGAWIDETALPKPVSRRSIERVQAESAWTDLGTALDVPVALLRLSGIYGPGRNAFVNLAAGTAKRLIKPGQVFNRIHVEDIAGALWLLAERRLGGAFNITDDEPAPPQDVVTYAAQLMGIDPPPEEPYETAELSAMARSFYGESKRVSNAAIKKAGYRFQFPTYRAALDAMWQTGNWQATETRPKRSPIRG